METNQFCIAKDAYQNEADFWKDVSSILDIFTKQDYAVLFRYEDCGVYVIEYAYDAHKDTYGADRFMLVTADEEDRILGYRAAAEDFRGSADD